jgi:solute carrier family 25 phosphate transporter 3
MAMQNQKDLSHYMKLFAAGGTCASFSHAITVPIDVVKTKMQVTPGLYSSLYDGMGKIYAKSGVMGLLQGFMPTMYGYAFQGALKYGFYEFIKDQMNAKNPDYVPGTKPSISKMVTAAAIAECCGSSTLVPFEAARIRMVCCFLLLLPFHSLVSGFLPA